MDLFGSHRDTCIVVVKREPRKPPPVNNIIAKNTLLIIIMGVTKETLRPGDGTTFPQQGDKLTMHYQLSCSCAIMVICDDER